MRRVVVFGSLLFLISLACAYGQNATVKELTGKVQLEPPGGTWVNAAVGSVVTQGTLVSTGFNSSAVLDLGTSQLQVKQLTRMKLNELIRSQGTVTTSLFLTVGAVRANVASNLGVTQKFEIQSPVSTAAVRGTIFDFDGFTVSVERGIVRFTNINNLGRNVGANQGSELAGAYVPQSAQQFAAAKARVSTNTNPTAGTGGGGGKKSTPPSAGSSSGTLVITVAE